MDVESDTEEPQFASTTGAEGTRRRKPYPFLKSSAYISCCRDARLDFIPHARHFVVVRVCSAIRSIATFVFGASMHFAVIIASTYRIKCVLSLSFLRFLRSTDAPP
jgi:hypothetical protein